MVMKRTVTVGHPNIPTAAVSIALLCASIIWLVSASVYYTTSAFSLNWAATPLPWVAVVILMPSICFATSLILVDLRKRAPLSRLDWCALGVAGLPVLVGTLLSIWAVVGLFRMAA